MEKNIFQLDNEQLKEIARSFKAKVEEGLNTENAEIQCIPTFITPKASSINGKSLVLDLGGSSRTECGRHAQAHPRQGGERAEFPAIRPARRRAGQLLQELLPPVQGTQPLRFLPGCGRA